jgi:hypothetical protein
MAKPVLEIATSLLVSLSAQFLKWQNPGEACGELLQVIALKYGGPARGFFARALSLRNHSASS